MGVMKIGTDRRMMRTELISECTRLLVELHKLGIRAENITVESILKSTNVVDVSDEEVAAVGAILTGFEAVETYDPGAKCSAMNMSLETARSLIGKHGVCDVGLNGDNMVVSFQDFPTEDAVVAVKKVCGPTTILSVNEDGLFSLCAGPGPTDGGELHEEGALAILLRSSIVAAGEAKDWQGNSVIGLYVNCGGVFEYGGGDAESLKYSEIAGLFLSFVNDKSWGMVKWCAKKRRRPPLDVHIKAMKASGAWDNDLETIYQEWQIHIAKARGKLICR